MDVGGSAHTHTRACMYARTQTDAHAQTHTDTHAHTETLGMVGIRT